MTRGMRNNNPLNIRRVKGQKWKGEAPFPPPLEGTGEAAGPFVHFSSLTYGHHAVCIEDIITRWAPPTENDTHKYILDVCKLTGFGGKERLTENNWPQLVKAMARIESGMNLTEEQIQQAFQLYKQ